MKEQALVVVSKIPAAGNTRKDFRLSCIIRALGRRYDVAVMSWEAVGAVGDAGTPGKTVTVPSGIAGAPVLAGSNYRVILFDSSDSARCYLPFVDEYSPQSLIIIDTASSAYLSHLHSSRMRGNLYRHANSCWAAERHRLKELAVYSHADMLIASTDRACEELAKDVPLVEVRAVKRHCLRDADALLREMGLQRERARKRAPANCRSNLEIAVARRLDGAHSARSLIDFYNGALAKMSRDFIFLTSRGVTMADRALDALLFCARSNPLYGMVAPVSNRSLAPARARHMREHYRMNFGLWQEARWVDGHCLLVRKALRDSAGVLDSRFLTMEYASYDYCLKALQAGYRTILAREAFVRYRSPAISTREALEKDHRLLYGKWGDRGAGLIENLKEFDS